MQGVYLPYFSHLLLMNIEANTHNREAIERADALSLSFCRGTFYKHSTRVLLLDAIHENMKQPENHSCLVVNTCILRLTQAEIKQPHVHFSLFCQNIGMSMMLKHPPDKNYVCIKPAICNVKSKDSRLDIYTFLTKTINILRKKAAYQSPSTTYLQVLVGLQYKVSIHTSLHAQRPI